MTDRLVTAFKAWHLGALLAKGAVEGEKIQPIDPALLERHNTWSCLIDGEPVAVGGTIELWPGRHQAWALFVPDAGRYMVLITGAAARTLEKVKGRIEMTVRQDYEKGHRWARMLRFEVETPELKAYGPEGESHVGYVRFN